MKRGMSSVLAWKAIVLVQAFLYLICLSGIAVAQKEISCPDGKHLEIDVNQISIKYDASSFAGTLSSLSVLGARLQISPHQLQEAAVATQQWDEFLKGLAVGYNTCAVTRQQYADGLNRIYPRLKEDATSLEEIRRVLSEGHRADEKRLQTLVESYYNNIRQFARASGKEIILDRIETLSQQVSGGQTEILRKEDLILDMLNRLDQENKQSPVPTPAEVGNEIREIRKNLLAKADQAEAAYQKGYKLLDQYRFQESIPYLQEALADVRLPDFYLALGRAYRQLPDLKQAEVTLRDGLALVDGKGDDEHEAPLAGQLGLVLLAKGDLIGALSYAQRALKIDENVYGTDNPEVATRANNIGLILEAKGDLEGALSYAQRALKIDEKVYGPDNPEVATDSNNIGQILKAKGDVDGALSYTQRALNIDENAYGADHPEVATDSNNIGQILQDKGDLDGALSYTQRALKIDEKIYGPDHPTVAIRVNNIGLILEAKKDLNGALSYTQRALKIDENVYGPDHPSVSVIARNIGQILQAKGDLDGALSYTQRALKIDEKVYGLDHYNVAISANYIGQILQAKGDLDGALSYTQRALRIWEQWYGPDDPSTKTTAANLARIKKAKHQ
jgi:tetratricopeptide (TPR) repeat protein